MYFLKLCRIWNGGIITISENGTVTMPTAPVWMTMQEMADLFMVFYYDIRKAIRSIYKNHELLEEKTKRYIRQDNRIRYEVYSFEMVIALAFRLRSKECMAFRKFIMERLYAPNREKPLHLFFSLSDANPRYRC